MRVTRWSRTGTTLLLRNKMELDKLSVLDIQPSQFHISEEKLERIGRWFDPLDLSNFEPIPIKKLNGRVIFTDGHTRAFAAWRAGVTRVPLAWDEDELDWELYQACVDACLDRKIASVADLNDRILPPEEYAEQWNGWCDELHRKMKKDAP